MKSDTLPVTFGMEVESNYPSPESIARTIGSTDLPLATRESILGTNNLGGEWQNARGLKPAFFERFPENLRFPAGWSKETDHCGMECKFTGPVESRKEVIKRITDFSEFLKAWGIRTYDNCGTHIHVGIPKMIEQIYAGTSDKARILRLRAESAAIAYLQLRSNALKMIVPPHRRTNEYCKFPFPSPNGAVNVAPLWSDPAAADLLRGDVVVPGTNAPGTTAYVNAKTPIWVLHNMFLTGKSTTFFGAQGSYGCVVDRRRYPTFEFRLFPGTGVKRDLLAYARLVLELVDNVGEVIGDQKNLRAVEVDEPSAFAVNPYKYAVTDLHAELKSPWLKKWVKATCGEIAFPETDEDETTAPEAVRCAA